MKKILLSFVFCVFLTKSYSQIDTSFWFVAPDISQGLGDRPIYLYFNTYSLSATVKVSQPANGAFVQITKIIPANSIDSINLTAFIASIENDVPNSVLNRGLYISSTQKISALYSLRSTTNREYYSLKGPKALGVDFYVPMQEFWNQSPATSPKSFSSFDIVATLNNTTVLITPKTDIIGHLANVTYSVLLQKGQTYSCQDTTRSATTSLAGSIVSSNKLIAVTIQSSGLNQSGCLSSVGDQITATNYLGTDYIINKGKGSTEKIFILSTQNNTQLTIDDGAGVTSHFMNFGENYIYTATQGITYVKSTKPVYALHVSGYGCRLSGAQLPAFFCAGTYTSSFTRASSDSLALNLSTRTGYEGNFKLNGNAGLIPASAFTVVPGSAGAIKSARIFYSTATIPVGSHNIVTNSGDVFGLGILNGSYNKGSSYGYVSEFVSYPSINAGNDFTICANGKVVLNAQIGGGNITGVWSTNGYGTFNGGFSALTNTYTPSQLDTTLKPVKLFLTTSGPCPQLKDTLVILVKPSPLVNASIDQIVCGNNSNVLLNGSVSGGSSTGIWSSLGSGTFTPNNTTFNATYLPSVSDTLAGSVKLILTSTGNGICTLEKDTVKVTYTKIPTVNAGPASISVCANNSTVSVSGSLGGSATTGKWTTNGTGSFSPSNVLLATNYLPSTADLTAGQVKIYLSTTNNGNCNQAKDSILITFTSAPLVNAGLNISTCLNNISTVLAGIISGTTTTGIWSGGLGSYTPNNTVLTATYTPSASELTAGLVNLTLSSTNNGNCNTVTDNVLINFTSPASVNAGIDLFTCKNNSASTLSGIISGTTTSTGIWSGGLGTFNPNNTSLNAIYTPNASELAAGFAYLKLTSTNNGNCKQVKDSVLINYTASPIANAGVDFSACKNNIASVLSGTVSGATVTGVWSGGSGTFNPSSSVLNATYTPSGPETTVGFVKLILTSTNNGNCLQVKDTVLISFTNSPLVNAGINISACKNNASTVLSGSVTVGSTTGIWSGGLGSYTPNNTVLTATYTPSASELTAGLVNLTLSSTNNGNCNTVTDNVLINFTSPASVNAGIDLFTCKNNSASTLSGIISGTTTTGVWSGGLGTFNPNNTSLNAIYTPNASELAAGFAYLKLTSTNNGNCNQVKDSVLINYTASPIANAGVDFSACKNNIASVLSGTVSGATVTGVWSGGSGTFNPSSSVLNATYTPSGPETTVGFVKLILTSTNNGNCLQVKDTVLISFTNSPLVNAGINISACKNNASTVLSGSVTVGSTTGIWSGGLGSYTPNNTVLTATYTPSASELTAGLVNLTLSSTNNGNCNTVTDNVLIAFTNAPTVNAGIDLLLCKNNPSATLSGIISGTTTTGVWSGGLGTYNPNNTSLNAIYTPNASELASGFVYLKLISSNNGNCNQVKDSVLINYINSPTVDAGLNLFACKNNIATGLSGLVSGPTTTGVWSGGLGTYNPNNAVLNATYTPSASEIAAGQIKLFLTSTNNNSCFPGKDSVFINITNSPIVNAGIDLNSCKNNAFTVLSGVITGTTTTGVWSGGLGTYSPSSAALNATYTPSASEIAAGSVYLTLTSTNNANCNAVNDLIKINFVAKPFANFNFNNVCLNNATSYSDFSLAGIGTINTWQWTFGDNSTTSTQNTAHTYSASGTYSTQLVVKNSYGCYDTIKKSSVVYPLPNAYFGMKRICNGTLLNLTFLDSSTIASPETINQWLWDFGGPGQNNIQNPTQLFPGSGFYNITLIATSNHNCKDTIIKQINLTPRPVAGFAHSVSSGINIGTTVNFVDTSSYASSWSWNFGDLNNSNSILQNPETIYYNNGTFIITQIAYDAYGCSDTARVAIKINNVTNEISTLIPNAISPNGDGKNDVWKLDFLNLLYPNASVEIFNRWGELMFSESGGYTIQWDGTYKGEKLPVGTYYYVLKLNDSSMPNPFKGGILLLK